MASWRESGGREQNKTDLPSPFWLRFTPEHVPCMRSESRLRRRAGFAVPEMLLTVLVGGCVAYVAFRQAQDQEISAERYESVRTIYRAKPALRPYIDSAFENQSITIAEYKALQSHEAAYREIEKVERARENLAREVRALGGRAGDSALARFDP